VILIDSSVLIDYLHDRQTWATERLDELIDRTQLAVGDLILMEVLQGIRNLRELRMTEQALNRFHCFELAGAERARAAAANYRLLRSIGITPRSPIDVLIATFCIEEGVELLADDRDFRLMAPHLGLVLAGPLLS
jgi:predicted nucleic acid-binding protein